MRNCYVGEKNVNNLSCSELNLLTYRADALLTPYVIINETNVDISLGVGMKLTETGHDRSIISSTPYTSAPSGARL